MFLPDWIVEGSCEVSRVVQALSSGGDVKHIAKCALEGDRETGIRFFKLNYQVDYAISQMQKPCIVLMDGVTFGGGCGLSMHARFKISTEKCISLHKLVFDCSVVLSSTNWAMPETQIGYFPDCGFSFPSHQEERQGKHWGLFHALTGIPVNKHVQSTCPRSSDS